MAKSRRYYYECISPCQLGWWGPDQRKERWIRRGSSLVQPTHVQHLVNVYPSKGITPRGEPIPPDYVVTDQPLGKQYTQEIVKKVLRPHFDQLTGRRNGRSWRKKISTVKFRLLDMDEVDGDIKRRAKDYPWQETLFEDKLEAVTLPGRAAALDKKLDEEEMEKEEVVLNE
jgi:hypothetical protein